MSNDIIPQQVIVLVTLVIGIIGLYLMNIPILGSILSIVVIVLAVILGANTLRCIGRYSLGAGLPSVIYLLTSAGVIGSIVGLTISIILDSNMLSPVVSLITAALIGYILSLICKYIFDMNIKILSKSFVEISLAAMLAVTSLSTLITTTYNPTIILNTVIKTGFIVLILIMVIMAIQSPYNSCIGPNEDQIRTLMLAISNAFLIITIVSVISLINNTFWYIWMIIGIIGWIWSYKKYIKYSMRQAASVRWYGLWPNSKE